MPFKNKEADREYHRRYQNTEKGRLAFRVYRRRFKKTEKGRLSELRWETSEKYRRWRRERDWRRYGIVGATYAGYVAVLAAQGGVCGICGKPPGRKALAWDHNWSTGQARGALCVPCNRMVAAVEQGLVNEALQYLARYAPPPPGMAA